MKVLLYNWVQFDDWRLRGGGVSVYLTNLISGLIKENDVHVTFLSSGKDYDLFSRKVRIRETKNRFSSNGVRSYQIINSPIVAPAHFMFCELKEQLENEALREILTKFIEKTGPYDIIHFQNIEGISIDVFELKKIFPKTKFLLTAHNYHIICPQIELFSHGEKVCTDFKNGQNCINCIGWSPNTTSLKRRQSVVTFVENLRLKERKKGECLYKIIESLWGVYRATRGFLSEAVCKNHNKGLSSSCENINIEKITSDRIINRGAGEFEQYLLWRNRNINEANKYLDKIICVSDLTRTILEKNGLKLDKLITLLNGMDYSSTPDQAKRFWEVKRNGGIHLGYFGYPTAAKGLAFFLKAMLKVPENLLGKIRITIASRVDSTHRQLIEQLSEKVEAIFLIEGYERKRVPDLMSSINLGVIPSLWWETYCQVGAEMLAFGTPLLISDSVGLAQHIANQDFIFESGNEKDFINKITDLLKDPVRLNQFWNGINMPISIEEHVKQLLRIYRQ